MKQNRLLALALATSQRETTVTKQPPDEMRELLLRCEATSAGAPDLFQRYRRTVITALLHWFTDAPPRDPAESEGRLLNGVRCALGDGIEREKVT